VLYAFHGVCRAKSAAGPSTAGPSAASLSNADDSVTVPVTTDQLINSSCAPPVQVHAGFSRRRTPASKVVKRKKYEMADMVRLQMRQLQVERERLALERQKVKCLEGIREELIMVRLALGNTTGFELMAVSGKED
jgi:hypothetical protein